MPTELVAGSLRLCCDADLDPSILRLLQRDIDAIADTLDAWGRFLAPVRVASAADLDRLRHLADAPTDGPLCAVATPGLVALLEPRRWPTPPADHQLRLVLTHELAHALLFQRCAPVGRQGAVALPCWFREGMAMLATEGRPDSRRRMIAARQVELATLAHADAATIAADAEAVYEAALTLFDAWYEHFGSRRLGTLCRAMRAGLGFDEAHHVATGVGPRRWVDATIASLSAHARDDVR